MESLSAKERSVLASTLAVLATIGLTLSVTYALPPSPRSTNPIPSSDCLSSVPNVLNLPYNITLKEDGTTTIGNTTYWFVSFIPRFTDVYLGSYVTFHGVDFYMDPIVQRGGSSGASGPGVFYDEEGNAITTTITSALPEKISVAFETVMTARTADNAPCPYALPWFTVMWPTKCVIPQWPHCGWDGRQETYNAALLSTRSLNNTSKVDITYISFPQYLPNPWFTHHTSPRAGIAYQTNGGKITFYVSTS
jgi:hypothetical protein